jgi:hypothetical protein
MRPFKNWFKSNDLNPIEKTIKSSTARKQVSKRFKANQQAGRYVHIMDNNMFNTVKMMFESADETNKQMATDIVLKSKMTEEQINYFVNKWCGHFYEPKNKI